MPTIFLPLEPQGLGTRDIEAFDSYLLRLAAEHGVSEYQFHRVVAHWWNQTKEDGEQSLGGHITYITKIGHGRDIDALVRAIERGTGFLGVSGMTLSAFRDLSGPHVADVVRKIHQWCPACLKEWEAAGLPIYEKLQWRLSPITRCTIHGVALEDCCPSCGRHQARHEDTWPSCYSCGENLSGDAHLWRMQPRATEGESDLIDVIEYCACHPDRYFEGSVARRFWQMIREGRLETHRISYEYLHLRKIPHRTLISVLLGFAQDVNVPLLSILLDPNEASAIRPLPYDRVRRKPQGKRHRLSLDDRKALRRDLILSARKGCDAPSLTKICRKHGCSPSVARYWYPDLVEAILTIRRAQRLDLLHEYERRLDSLHLDDSLKSRATLVGWHEATRDTAQDLDVPIWLVRRRIAILRGRRHRATQ